MSAARALRVGEAIAVTAFAFVQVVTWSNAALPRTLSLLFAGLFFSLRAARGHRRARWMFLALAVLCGVAAVWANLWVS